MIISPQNAFNHSDNYCFLPGSACDTCDLRLFATEDDVIKNAAPLIKQLQGYLDSKGYKSARAIMDLMLEKSTEELKLGEGKGLRDDKKTPRAIHELTQAAWIINTIEAGFHVGDPEIVIALAFAHDLGEDYGVLPEELEEILIKTGDWEKDRTKEFMTSFDAITKYYGDEGRKAYKNGECKGKNIDGRYSDEDDYQYGVRHDKHASLVKMFDRAHNLMTLVGVKDTGKILEEICKTAHYYADRRFEPMCGIFPSQRPVYEMMRNVLEAQSEILRYTPLGVSHKLPKDDELLALIPAQAFQSIPPGLHPLLTMATRIRKESLAPKLTAHYAHEEEPLPPGCESVS